MKYGMLSVLYLDFMSHIGGIQFGITDVLRVCHLVGVCGVQVQFWPALELMCRATTLFY